MPRYRLTLEYDGAPFVGWQRQANGLAVQQAVEDALLALCGTPVRITGAGRTDAGVHALGQVAHADLLRAWRPEVLRDALNAHLRPHSVAVLAAAEVPDTFDARFSAEARHYLYRICNRRMPLTLRAGRAWLVKRPLDVAAMAEAAHVLRGKHDFTTFRAAECQANSPVRTLETLEVDAVDDEIHVRAKARSFLHHQVRSIVGSLEWVGTGRWTRQDLAAALAARDRARCGPVAPACGLYFVGVDYPDEGKASEPSRFETPLRGSSP